MSKQISVNLAFTADASQAKIELQNLQKQLQALSTTSPVNQFDLTKKSIKEAATAAAQLKVQLEAATNAKTGQLDLSKFNASLKQSGMTLAEYQAKLAAMGPAGQQAFSSLTRSVLQAEVSLKRSNTLISQLGIALMNTARWQLSSSLLHGFMGAVQSAYSYSKDLNESLNNIRIVTGQNTEQMAKFADQANRAAKELGTTTTNYTNASLIYYQQGLSDSEVKTRTDITIKMANVARTSAEKVSDQMTAVWNNFDDGSKSLEYYADVMTALGAATASSTDEISQGLNKFAAVAETVGLSYEYAASALATITSNTRESADVVGNSLKTLFARIQGLKLGETLEDGVDLNKYSEALDTVGIKVLDSNGELRRMDDLLNELAAKWDTIGKAEQTALAQTVAGVRQYTQLIALMENWDNGDNDSMVANLRTSYGSTGALAEQAKIYEESWEAARKSVKASAEDVYDSILDDKFFIKLSNGFADFLDIISNTMDALGGMKGVISGLGAVLLAAFGDKLAAGIDNFTNKLLFSTEAAKKMKIEAVQAQANNIQGSTLSDKSVSILNATEFGKASQNSAYETQYRMQLKLIESANTLNNEESRVAATLLDQNRAALEQVSSNAKLLETAEQRANREKITLNYALSQSKASQQDIAHAKTLMGMYESYSKKLMGAQGVSSILGNIRQDETDLETLRTKVTQLHQAIKATGTTSSDLINVEPDKMELQELLKYIDLVKQKKVQPNNTLNEDYLTKMTQGVGNKLFDFALNMGLDRSIVDGYLNSIGAMVSANGDLVDSNNNVIATKEEYEAYLERMKAKTYSFGSALVSLSSMITSVSMAINQLKGMKDIWSNEDLSTGEKLLSTLSSMALVVPMLANAFRSENIARLAGLKIKKQELITQILTNAGLVGETVATESLTVAITKLIAKKLMLNWQAALLIAVFVALAATIAAVAKEYNKEAEEAKKAAEVAQELSEKSEEAKNKANDLKSAFDDYGEIVDKLEACTKGTQEWKDALQEVYNKVTEILAKYPELAKIEGLIKQDGTIDESKFEELVEEAGKFADIAEQAAIMGSRISEKESYESDVVDVGRKIGNAYDYYDKDNGEWRAMLNIGQIMAENATKLVDETDSSTFEEALRELIQKPADMTDAAYDTMISSLLGYENELKKLAQGARENATALENSARLITRQHLGEEVSDAVVKMSSEAYTKTYDEIIDSITNEKTGTGKKGINAWSGKNDKQVADLWERYLKATNQSYELDTNAVVGKDNARFFQYIGEDHKPEKISLEEMAAAIAAAEALDALEGAAEGATEALGKIQGPFNTDINNFIATGNFDSSSESNVNEMREAYISEDGSANREKIIADFGGEEEIAKIAETLAPKDLGDFENATDWFINDFVTSLQDIDFSDIGAHLTDSVKAAFDVAKEENNTSFANLNVGEQANIANLFDNIFAQAGKSGLDTIQEIFKNQDLDADELKKITEILSSTDWNSTSIEDLSQAFVDGGIAAENMEGPLGILIQLMKEAAGITGLSANVEKYKKYQEIKEKVEDGEGISEELYNELPDNLKTFFNYTAEGLWALMGDAKAFYELISGEQVNSFDQDNQKLEAENTKIDSYLGSTFFGYDTMSNYQGSYDAENNKFMAQNLLDYLTLTGGIDDSAAQEYATQIENDAVTAETVNALVDALKVNGDQTQALTQKLESNRAEIAKNESAIASQAADSEELAVMRQSGKISGDTYGQWEEAAVDKEIETEGFDSEEIDNLADAFENAAGESSKFSEDLKDNEAGLKEVAKEAKRYDRAVEALADNYKEWSKALKSGDVGKQAKAMKELSKVYGDMLDIDADEIPESFLASAENLDLMKKAAEGSQDAFDQLQANVSFDRIKEKVGELPGWTKEKLEEIASHKIQAGELIDFGEGATGLGAQLTDLYTDAANAARQGGATVAEALAFANQVMADEGFNAPEIEMEEKTVTVTGKLPSGWTPQENGTVTTVDANGNPQTVKGVKIVAQEGDTYTYEQTMLVPKGKGKIGKSAERIGGGGGKKGGGGGGGGGSKKKDAKKASDEIERYHEIKEVISDLERQYDRINKARTRAFGMEAVDLMDQEIDKTEELITAQKKYLSEIQANQKKDKSALATYGATFDKEGRITNYDEIMSQQLAKFNASRTEAAEEAYEEFKKILEQYEETQNLLEEQEASLEDLENRLYDQKLEKVDIEVQLKLSLADDSLKYIEFLMTQLEDDAYDVAEAFALLGQEAANYRNQINTANEGIADILANHGIDLSQTSIEDIVKNGKQLGLTAEEIEKIREYRDTAMSAAQALAELKQIAVDKVTGAFDAWNEKFTTQIEILEHYSSVMESFANIVDIVGKETLGITDEMMSKWTQSSVDNSINTLASQRKRLDALRAEEQNLRAQLAAAATEEEKDMIQKALDHIIAETNSAEEEMMAQWEATLEAAAQAFEQAVDTSINAFEKAISGTYGSLDALQTAFDQASEIADRYVDDYKEIYELSKLNRDITNSIDNTDNVKAKKALRDLQKEIVELQESDVQMSEYDLEHLRAKYELRLAEIALEEAQNAKSQVRMRKDSEGNYSYVFTADASAVEKAQQDYETKLYEMQELNSEYIKEMQNNILQSEIELANALRELDRAKFKSDEEYYAEVNRLTQYYTGQRNYYLDEMNKGITNNQETVNEDWKRYSDATGYKMSADKDYLDNFDETIYAQLTGYRSIEDAQNQFADATKVMVEDLRSAFKKWQDNTEEAMKAAGTSIADFGKTVNETVYGEDGEGGISKASDDIVNQMDLIAEGMAEAFGPDAMAAFKEFAEDYVEWMQPMIDATSELVGDINDLITLEADLNKKEQEKEDEEDEDEEDEDDETTGPTVTNPYGKPSSLNGNYQNYTERSGVKAIQHALKEMGYDIGSYGIDGKYGSATAAAVKAFQKASGITADGIVGPDTKAKFKAKGYLTGGRVDSTGWAWLDGTPDRPEYVLNADQTDAFIRLVDDLHYMNELKKLADIQEKGMYMIDNTAKELMDSLSFIDDVMRIIELNAGMQSIGLGTLSTSNSAMGVEPAIQQEITIHAEFPDATDHNEIEAAFDSLFVRASQFANRKN